MADNRLTLSCLVDGESTSNAFPIEIESTKTIGDLKKLIKAKKTPEYDDIAVGRLTLWRVSIPDDNQGSAITIDALDDKTELDSPRTRLFKLFLESPDDNTIILVQRPRPAPKREHEEDMAPPPKKTRRGTNTLMGAIEEAGLTQKATVNGQVALSRLDNKERVSVLGFLGSSVHGDDSYVSLSRIAFALRNSSFQEKKILSTPRGSGTLFPVINTENLYVRQAYKDLYDEIDKQFNSTVNDNAQKHVVVTGTSDIGKSAFLVYFTIRLLATSSDDNPSIVIFQERRGSVCYIYGGPSTLRYGDIEDFRPFLDLPETWYLVDSSPNPLLERAKTIISVSPKTLYTGMNQYQEVDKRVPWRYYMAPWTLEELKRCRSAVEGFKVVPEDLMEELYRIIGGVPRFVLETPMKVLNLGPGDTTGAKKSACARVLQAIDLVRAPLRLMQCFEQGEESPWYSSHLLHRWPTEDHKDFCLEWASAYIADKIGESLQDVTRQQILEKLAGVNVGTAKRPMFELYVRHIFRKGSYEFQTKKLQDGTNITFKVPAKPSVE
ncbi:hypothetical protein BG011_001367 [Mortierella polycephala]|uniref:Crinkler effector protein N-terminal domain-containing protein n=1 Tax=Mortierella polycephala TaxID=41804 RepID=A0A9P6PKA2_9FUNG|nr:hypothetical protein BG011_001367 [Mortierella polycephala]